MSRHVQKYSNLFFCSLALRICNMTEYRQYYLCGRPRNSIWCRSLHPLRGRTKFIANLWLPYLISLLYNEVTGTKRFKIYQRNAIQRVHLLWMTTISQQHECSVIIKRNLNKTVLFKLAPELMQFRVCDSVHISFVSCLRSIWCESLLREHNDSRMKQVFLVMYVLHTTLISKSYK